MIKIRFLKDYAVTKPSGKVQEFRDVIKKGEVREIMILAAESLIREGIAEKVS